MGQLSIRKEGLAGRITLTRPEALNALSPEMSVAIEEALILWAHDPEVALVVIDAEGDRAFCAGGDIAGLWRAGQAGDFAQAEAFWRQEYRLNLRLATYAKPTLSFMQGYVLGGGVGLGCHLSHRILDAGAKVGMPECGIGLIPDTGGSYLLSRATGRLGEYLGLTGIMMGAGDAVAAGFADFTISREHWPDLIATLCETGAVPTLAGLAQAAPTPLHDALGAIDPIFATLDVAAIRAGLAGASEPVLVQAAEAMARNSPLSLAATLALVRQARAADLAEALRKEFRFTARALAQSDFLEGVRAQVIDKDRTPVWAPAPEAAHLAQMLAPLPEDWAEDKVLERESHV